MRRSTVEDVARSRAPRLALLGLLVLARGTGLLALAHPRAAAGLWGPLHRAARLGAAGAVGDGAAGAGGRRRRWARCSACSGAWPRAGVRASLSRTAVALAALMVAVATTVGVGLMVGSFRGTVVAWLEASLAGGRLHLPALAHGPARGLHLRARPGRAPARHARRRRQLHHPRGARDAWTACPRTCVAVEFAQGHVRPYRFKEGHADTVWRELEASRTRSSSPSPSASTATCTAGDTVRLRHGPGAARLPRGGRVLRLRLGHRHGADASRHVRAATSMTGA